MHVTSIDECSHFATGVDAAHRNFVVHAQIRYLTLLFVLVNKISLKSQNQNVWISFSIFNKKGENQKRQKYLLIAKSLTLIDSLCPFTVLVYNSRTKIEKKNTYDRKTH